MDLAYYKFELHDGLPPDGEAGLYFGFDEDMNSYVMWWLGDCWRGVGRDRVRPEMAFCFQAREEMAGFIKKHAAAPMPWSAVNESDDAGRAG